MEQEKQLNPTKATIKGHKGFIKGFSGNPAGKVPMTEEFKTARRIRWKAEKEIINDYKSSLINALPIISPVLISKAVDGDLGAIKEVNDRTLGKAIQINQNDNSMTVTFTLLPEEREKIDKLLLHD